MSGANHPTPETKSPICPHGNDTRIVWCVWCNDPARMTAAAQPGPPPVMMTVGGSSERSIPATSNTETCPRCGGPYGTGSYHEELVCQEIQIDRLTRELGEARKAHDKDFMDGHKHVYRLQVERDRLRAALEEFIRLRKVAVESAVVPSTWWSDSERAYAEAQCLLSGEPSAHETSGGALPIPSGWQGKEPWFKVGDKVLPLNALYRYYPVHTVTEITDWGFKYSHKPMPFGPARNGEFTAGGETFEPSHYELAADQSSEKASERQPGHVITCNHPNGPLFGPGCSCPRVHDSSG